MTTTQTVIKNPTWWRRRTLMERYCTVLAAAAIFLCGVLTIALSILYVRETERPESMPSAPAALDMEKGISLWQNKSREKGLCLTPGCVYAAAEVLNSMNKDVDPCDNFYQFVCGNFLKETKIPDDKTSVTLFSKIDDKLTEQLRVIIEEPSAEDEPRPYRMAKDLYKSCMNRSDIEEKGLTYIKELVQKMGGWPVLEGDQWDPAKFTWKDTVYKFKDEGFSIDYLIDFSITTDYKNSTKRVIDLDQASLSLSREYLVKGMEEKLVQALYSYMVDIATMFGADRDRATKELKESLDFEIELAKISMPPEKRRDANRLYNPRTIPELQERYPSIPWVEYISTILPKSVPLMPDEVVILDEPKYIEDLEALLSNTPKRVQANYMLWRAVASSVSSLTESLRKRQLEYGTALSGRTEREPRWKECVGLSAGSLSLAVGSLYVQRFFKQEAKKNALEMVDNIREQMYKILQNVDWMDEETRKNGLEKARAMTSHIAYPDEILDSSKLEEFYQKLEITQGNYLESVLNLTKFGLDFSFGRLRKPVNKTDWISHGRPAIVNAFYSSIENSIQFPAGILQGAFFSHDRPNYMNYGAIGFVIGHEITHGFDDQGRQFDKNGNLVDWWATETKEAYLKKADCIIKQYGDYKAEEVGLNLNGVNTQGENIADNGGIKQAYYAYQHWVKEHGREEDRLPGLQDFTPQQMFWISAANTWCSKYRPETLKLRIITGQHSPGEFRVRGPFSNRPEFAKDFSCPTGSKMNPTKKCQVW
ncbi:neprilysin-2 isoform X2 [Macrosteles quadrilineatus]|uniref:neprilysin-2 isoform X2 n=1 Tax=Macrosteles quadrilineatus TaxID=74068 RepID=UPI0023E12FD3|nr:neprilysin-2 isoform X2 [Macrosteles quadrilineatus]